MTCLPFFDYFVFLDGLCANALPAAVLDFALVRPSRKTSDAAEAALAEVSLLFCIFQSPFLYSIKKVILDKTRFLRQNIDGFRISNADTWGLVSAGPFLFVTLLYLVLS